MSLVQSDFGQRAVVLGAGIGGLFAARVLADEFAEVVLVDRDRVQGVGTPRRGVPQGQHSHALQARGLRIAEDLFPGLTDGLVADGAGIGDVLENVSWIVNGKQLSRPASRLTAVTASRPFLERHVRERVGELPNVTFREGTNVLGLETTPDRTRVTGVRISSGDGRGEEETLTAAVVVDATGRASRTPAWLQELGYPQVDEERLNIGLGYTSQHFRLSGRLPDGTIAVNDVASRELPRGAALGRIDGDRIIVTGYGILGDHPPTEPAGFLRFIRSLSKPDIHDVIKDAEPLDEPVRYLFPTSLRRYYERMPQFPDGLLVLGDAVCSFNPVYAQGMTVAALSALVLRRHLRSPEPLRPSAYFRDVAREVIDGTWGLMTVSDLRFPGVQGRRTVRTRLLQAYARRVQAAATTDGEVAGAYMRVVGLLERPGALHRPRIVLRVLRHALGLRASC
ncbi:FAD-dependent oxidoreductase [Streptomyces sp. NPDC018019]|uniref:FAD-dependent oxidoreductase n=1 Tax=Streptomyces sp. NPDC018019 TaxID=3365030 RepID=UPI0037AF7E92